MGMDTKGGDPRFHAKLARLADLHDKKNRDYSGGVEAKPLGNFERAAAILRLYPGLRQNTPFGVAITYLLKQLDAALILYSTGGDSVTGEGIPQRMDDVMVYAGLAGLLYEDEQARDRAEATLGEPPPFKRWEKLAQIDGGGPRALTNAPPAEVGVVGGPLAHDTRGS